MPAAGKNRAKKGRSKTVWACCSAFCGCVSDAIGSVKGSFWELFSNCCDDADESTEGFVSQIAYWVDRANSEKRSQALMMLGLGLVQVLVYGLTYCFVWKYDDWEDDPRPEDSVIPFIEGMWHSWSFMADPGPQSPAFRLENRIVAAIITVGGIFFFACVLGITVELFLQKMDSLRAGRSPIAEPDHILCLGWTQQSIHMIEELCLANQSNGGCVISVLSLDDKEFMEQELALQLPAWRRYGTRINVRSGSPLKVNDLLRVGAHRAKAIVILAPVTAAANQADANTVRVVLTLKTLTADLPQLSLYCLAEVRDIDNEPLLRTVCDESVEIIVSHDMIGRLMVMSVRQPGLAKVYGALLGFEGDEFYMEEWPEVLGQNFGDLQLSFPDAVPIGLMTKQGELLINPPAGRAVARGDKIVVIAEDRHSYSAQPRRDVEFSHPPARPDTENSSEKILICGWRRDVREVLKLIDRVSAPGTEVHMITHCVPVAKREKELLEDGFHSAELVNARLVHLFGNTSVRRQLDKLPLESFTSVMIFAESAFEDDAMYADSHSLATLLLLRDIQVSRMVETDLQDDTMRNAQSAVQRLAASLHRSGAMDRCPVVCEILSPQTQATIRASEQLTSLSDFCQTNKLIAQVMAMITEERAVGELLDQLLGSSGSSIAVVPSSRYALPQERVDFYELSQRAASFNEVLLGYQMRMSSMEGAKLNPPDKDDCLLWDLYDLAILQNRDYLQDLPHTSSSPQIGEPRASARHSMIGATLTTQSDESRSSMRQSMVHLTRGATSDYDLQMDSYDYPVEDTGQSQQAMEEPPSDSDIDLQNIGSLIRAVPSSESSSGHGYGSEFSRGVTERPDTIPEEDDNLLERESNPDEGRSPLTSRNLRQSLHVIQHHSDAVSAETLAGSTHSGLWKDVMQQIPAGERKKMRNSLSVVQEALSLADGDAAYAPSMIAQESMARMVKPSMMGVTPSSVNMGFAWHKQKS